MFEVSDKIQIPEGELTFTFTRSGGPGGQNVNKVNSKAVLRFSVENSAALTYGMKQRFAHRYGNRLTSEGDLIIVSQRYRDQTKNIDDCLQKLKELLLTIAEPEVPRRATKPTRASKERRVEAKRSLSQKKTGRKMRGLDD